MVKALNPFISTLIYFINFYYLLPCLEHLVECQFTDFIDHLDLTNLVKLTFFKLLSHFRMEVSDLV